MKGLVILKDGTTQIIEDDRQMDTSEYDKQKSIMVKQKRLAELTKDFAQVEAGLIIDDLDERKQEFRTLLNEVRVLQGKQPREINGG